MNRNSVSSRRVSSVSNRWIKKKEWAELDSSTRWLAYLVHIPRHMPRSLLHITARGGPYPFIVHLPSRYVNHKISVWIFVPPEDRLPKEGGSVPIHVDFHGGDFVMGGPFEQAPFCAQLARERGCIVLGVDYCIGPLFDYPTALEDAEDVMTAVFDTHGTFSPGRQLHAAISNYRSSSAGSGERKPRIVADTSRLSLSGFSSGGNIVLNLLLNLWDEGEYHQSPIPTGSQSIPVLLFYPQLEQVYSSYNRPAPDHEVSRPGRIGRAVERKLVPLYLPARYRRSPRASPLNADVKGLHRNAWFFVVMPGKDTLKGPMEEWIRRVREAGYEERVTVYRAPDMPHGWANFPTRFLGTKASRLKNDVMHAMLRFWDRAMQERSTVGDIRGAVSTDGYDGIGVSE